MQIVEPAPPTEKPKSKRGGPRPNSGRPPTKQPQPPKGQAFILPPLNRQKGVDQFENFVSWWQPLDETQINVMSAYVYRTWPLVDSTGGDPNVDKNLEIMSGPCPFTVEHWQTEIMGRWGSGSYMFMIKEGNVHRWTVYANNLRDLQNYPPLIDYRTLMVNDPANKDFVKWARTRGLIKDYNAEGDGDGMANAAIDRLVDQSDRLVNRVVEMSERQGTPPDVDTSAQLAGMEMIQRAGERALDVAMKSADRMAEMSSKSNDPLELVKAFTDMSKNMHGGGDNAIVEMMKAQRDADREEKQMLRQELADNRKLIFDLLAGKKKDDDDDEENPKGIMGMLLQFKTLKEGLADLGMKGISPGENTEIPAAKEKKDSLIELALRNAPVIMTGLDSILSKALMVYIQSKGGQPAQQAQQQPGSNVTQMPNPTNLNAPPPAPVTPLTPFLNAITPTFLHHMSTDGLGGDTFANWLISAGPITTWPQPGMNGRGVYDFLKESGKEAITQVLQTHPPIWQTAGQTPKKLEEFIDQLLKADDMDEEGEGEGGTGAPN